MNDTTPTWWRKPTNWPLIGFLAVAAWFLWTEHEAHVIAALPWLLVLGCVVMHLFMHRGHGGGGGGEDR
jgi:hypothetical protein